MDYYGTGDLLIFFAQPSTPCVWRIPGSESGNDRDGRQSAAGNGSGIIRCKTFSGVHIRQHTVGYRRMIPKAEKLFGVAVRHQERLHIRALRLRIVIRKQTITTHGADTSTGYTKDRKSTR